MNVRAKLSAEKILVTTCPPMNITDVVQNLARQHKRFVN